jgi:hypothetical protein
MVRGARGSCIDISGLVETNLLKWNVVFRELVEVQPGEKRLIGPIHSCADPAGSLVISLPQSIAQEEGRFRPAKRTATPAGNGIFRIEDMSR